MPAYLTLTPWLVGGGPAKRRGDPVLDAAREELRRLEEDRIRHESERNPDLEDMSGPMRLDVVKRRNNSLAGGILGREPIDFTTGQPTAVNRANRALVDLYTAEEHLRATARAYASGTSSEAQVRAAIAGLRPARDRWLERVTGHTLAQARQAGAPQGTLEKLQRSYGDMAMRASRHPAPPLTVPTTMAEWTAKLAPSSGGLYYDLLRAGMAPHPDVVRRWERDPDVMDFLRQILELQFDEDIEFPGPFYAPSGYTALDFNFRAIRSAISAGNIEEAMRLQREPIGGFDDAAELGKALNEPTSLGFRKRMGEIAVNGYGEGGALQRGEEKAVNYQALTEFLYNLRFPAEYGVEAMRYVEKFKVQLREAIRRDDADAVMRVLRTWHETRPAERRSGFNAEQSAE